MTAKEDRHCTLKIQFSEMPASRFFTLRRNNMFKKSLIALALTVAATGSFAQMYIQGSLGKGSVGFDCGTNVCQKTNPGNKFLLGYDAGNGLSYEGQIINYGKTTSSAFLDVKGTGYGGNVAYSGNFSEQFGYRVAGGLARNKIDTPSVTAAPSTASWQLAVGGGVAYNVNKSVALTADYDLSNAKFATSATATSSAAVSLFSIGVRAKF
jgi:opacity protein-like surface antigen